MILLTVLLSIHLQFGVGDGHGHTCEIPTTVQGNPLGDHYRGLSVSKLEIVEELIKHLVVATTTMILLQHRPAMMVCEERLPHSCLGSAIAGSLQTHAS